MKRTVTIFLAFGLLAFALSANEPLLPLDSTAVHELREVVVKGSNLRQTPTGYVISLVNQAIVKDKSATEMFNFLPDITVMDEAIKINGKDVTEIKVDGRRIDDYSLLQAIPASYIKSVTVNTFAGADNLSTSTGGTIEIELKPIASLGYYGQLSGGVTKYLRDETTTGDLSGMIRGRYKRFSFYESAQWHANKILSPSGYTYLRPEGVEYRKVNDRFKNFPFQNYLAMNLELAQGHDLGLNWITATSTTNSSYGPDNSEPEMRSHSKINFNTLSLLYRGMINDYRGRIDVSAEWLNHLNNNEQNLINAANNVDLRQRSNLLRFEAGIMYKVGENHIVKGGAKYLQTRTNIRQLQTAGESSQFTQTTIGHLPLVYASMEGFIGSVSYYAGLNWKMNRMQIKGQNPYSANAVQPTITIGVPYGRNKTNRLSFSYKYMLDNISYDAFNTRQMWVDPYIYSIGNPDIVAPTYHAFSLSSSFLNRVLTVGLNYRRTKNDVVWRTFSIPGSLVTYQTPVNMPRHDSYNITVNFSKELFKWWTMSLYAYAGFFHDNYFMGETMVSNTSFRHMYFTDNSFTFGGGWGASLNATLDPGLDNYNEHWHTVWQINVGAYKMLCNNRLMLRLSGTPARKHRRIDVHTADMTIVRKNLTKPQMLSFDIRWTFNGGVNKNASVNVTGSNLQYEENKASNGI